MKNKYFFSLFLEIAMYSFNNASGPARKRWKSPQKTLENLCPLPGAVGFMSVVNGPHNVHLYHIKLQEHYYNYKISSISCHAAARSEHPITFLKTCFLFLTFYWLIMDRSILQCTIPSILHFPAKTNETRENITHLPKKGCIFYKFSTLSFF